MAEEQHNNRNRVLSRSLHHYGPNTAGWIQGTYIANVHNKRQGPADINVLQLRILTNIFKIQKVEIHTFLNTVTAL